MPTFQSPKHCQIASADPQAKTWQRVCQSHNPIKTPDNQTDEKEYRTDNAGFAK